MGQYSVRVEADLEWRNRFLSTDFTIDLDERLP
jgi:hypothetical protein